MTTQGTAMTFDFQATPNTTERVYAPDGRSYTLRYERGTLRITSGKGSSMRDVVTPEPSDGDPPGARLIVLERLRALAPVAKPAAVADPMERARRIAGDVARLNDLETEAAVLRARILADMNPNTIKE